MTEPKQDPRIEALREVGYHLGGWHEQAVDAALDLIDELCEERDRLREKLESHDEDGRNVTNAQFVALREERNRLRRALDHALKGDMDPEDRVIIAQILDMVQVPLRETMKQCEQSDGDRTKINIEYNRGCFILGASWVYDSSWARRHTHIYLGVFVLTIATGGRG